MPLGGRREVRVVKENALTGSFHQKPRAGLGEESTSSAEEISHYRTGRVQPPYPIDSLVKTSHNAP